MLKRLFNSYIVYSLYYCEIYPSFSLILCYIRKQHCACQGSEKENMMAKNMNKILKVLLYLYRVVVNCLDEKLYCKSIFNQQGFIQLNFRVLNYKKKSIIFCLKQLSGRIQFFLLDITCYRSFDPFFTPNEDESKLTDLDVQYRGAGQLFTSQLT